MKLIPGFDLETLAIGDVLCLEIAGVEYHARVVDFGMESEGVWLQAETYRFFVDERGAVKVIWKKPDTAPVTQVLPAAAV